MTSKEFLRRANYWRGFEHIYYFFKYPIKEESFFLVEYVSSFDKKGSFHGSISSVTDFINHNSFDSVYVTRYNRDNYKRDYRFFSNFIHSCSAAQKEAFIKMNNCDDDEFNDLIRFDL